MRYFILNLLLVCFALPALSQQHCDCKSFRFSSKGDTLNCVDMNGKKQGKWLIHYDELRGEPGFEEEGEFKDEKKEGPWRIYSLDGELIATENYRWGFKDGIQQYFNHGIVEREESWRAMDPEKKYDTIDVPDLYDQYKSERKIIKIDSYTVKHGVWKYYRPGSETLLRTETYVFDKLIIPQENTQPNATSMSDTTNRKPPVALPKQITDYKKKNATKQ